MRKFLLTALLTIFTASLTVVSAAGLSGEDNPPKKTARMLRHAVFFKFKDSASPADIKKVEDAFRALPSKISEIKDFEWGTNNSPENLNQGYTHAFFLTFDSEAGRAAYLPHPAHKEFGKILGPYLDKVFVVDYWAEK